jgi:predicted DsbA family dithiol-disulfide isomerase
MSTPALKIALKIDFVSDVSCPWCAIGLNALELALQRIGADAEASVQFQPFELNPQMGPQGQDITEHLQQKYGASAEQQEQTRAMIRQRGQEVGFDFAMGKRSRIYNTFDAHRLLHWAGEQGRQRALKHALFEAYFTLGDDPSAHPVLQAAAVKAGLDGEQAAQVLASDRYAEQVRADEEHFRRLGISSVPAVIVNDRHLISGGQPADVFERALRQILAGA